MRSNRWFAALVSLALVFSPLTAAAQSPSPSQEPPPTPAAPPAPGQAPSPVNVGDQFHMHLYDQDYTNGQPALPNIFKPYMPMRLPQEVTENAATLDQLIHDGKLVLGLQDAVQLALQNNMDITVQRYVTYQADANVLSAKSGPGFVTQTGGFVSFDPTLNATLAWNRTSIPINNPFTSGAGTSGLLALNTQTGVGNVSYGQYFPTGSAFSVSLDNTRLSQSPTANFFNPSVTSSLNLAFQQNLLNGFGYAFNLSTLRIARITRKQADLQFEQQVITSVVAVMNQYYELVFAQQDVEVKQKTLALDEKLYNDNKRQVEIGTLAPIEVTRAASAVASAKGDLITSQTLALQQETVLKQLVFRDVMDPHIAQLPIVATDKPDENLVVPDIPLEKAVAEATTSRPDVKQAVLAVDAGKIQVKATRNLMLPTLTLTAQYGSQGLGGNEITTIPGTTVPSLTTPILTANNAPYCAPSPGAAATTVCPANTQEIYPETTTSPTAGPVIPGGLSDALSQVFKSNFPYYGASLNLSLPIRNRNAQAANIKALLQDRQNSASLQRLRNTVAVDVRNAQIQLAQSKAAVEADIKARILAEQTLDAEQKKFLLGASTTFVVVQTERDLATARSVEVRAMATLAEAKVNFDRALGRTLAVNRIEVADAMHAQPSRAPLIPGTPSSELTRGNRDGQY
jgi:outer membrane protein